MVPDYKSTDNFFSCRLGSRRVFRRPRPSELPAGSRKGPNLSVICPDKSQIRSESGWNAGASAAERDFVPTFSYR